MNNKKPLKVKFCFRDLTAYTSLELENSCPYPTYTPVIMWGRDKNFWVLMLYELRNCENKISFTKVFYCSPFNWIYFASTNLFMTITKEFAGKITTFTHIHKDVHKVCGVLHFPGLYWPEWNMWAWIRNIGLH